jgi:hypothetical protein
MATQANARGVSVSHPLPFTFPNSILNFDAGWEGTTGRDTLDAFEKGFGAIFDNPIIGVGVTSPGKQWMRVNDKWSEMIGYSLKYVVGLAIERTRSKRADRSVQT